MSKVLGIDLGTTNSCVAVADDDGARVLRGRTGQPTTPSMVAVADSGKRLVGHLAKRQAITNPVHTVYGAKRLIGRRWESAETQDIAAKVPFELQQGPHGDVRVLMGDRAYAVAEIASMVLNEMRLVAERELGESVHEAVITVPAYFNDNQRQATRDAGRIAGLDVLRIINEPTAAALAYGWGRDANQRVAIYDLGGGTFDISILDLGYGVFEVLATAGDTFLGGEDFDERIMQRLADAFQQEHQIDLRADRMALQRLRDAAERAKTELSVATEADINLPFIHSEGKGNAWHLQYKLTRQELDEMVQPLVDKTLSICERTLADSGLAAASLDAVILVGGMTRMPAVQSAVEEFFGVAPTKGVHPDEVVACGASIQGRMLSEGSGEALLLDVTPHHLGIMVAGGLFDVVIEKDTTIPTSAHKSFTTVRDNQTQVRILVLQGESDRADKNELLGEFLLDGLREAPKGQVKIEVTFEISADGIVSVSARDLETGREQAITVTASSGLTEGEIQQMMGENEAATVASEKSDAFERERLEVERALREVKKLLPEARPQIEGTEFGLAAVQKAEQAVATAQQALDARDIKQLEASREPLVRTVSMLRNVMKRLNR